MFSALRRHPPAWLKPDDLTSRIFANQKQILRDGHVHWAAIVQANSLLFLPGPVDSGAQVVYAPDNDLPLEALRQIASRLFSFKTRPPADPVLARIGQMLARETERALDWPVPPTLTGGRRVITTIVMIHRAFVPGGMLGMNHFPIIADPQTSLALLLPSKFWPESLVSQWSAHAKVEPRAIPATQLVRVTPGAAAVIRRTAADGATAMQLRCVPEGRGFRYALDVVPAQAPCVAYCQSEGVRVQVPDGYTLESIRGTIIDYRGKGFVINNPNEKKG